MPNDFLTQIKELGYSHEEVIKILQAGKSDDSESDTGEEEQQEAQTEEADTSTEEVEQSDNQGNPPKEEDKLKSFKDEIMKEVKEEIKNSLKVPRGQNPQGEQRDGHFDYPRGKHPAFEGMI